MLLCGCYDVTEGVHRVPSVFWQLLWCLGVARSLLKSYYGVLVVASALRKCLCCSRACQGIARQGCQVCGTKPAQVLIKTSPITLFMLFVPLLGKKKPSKDIEMHG